MAGKFTRLQKTYRIADTDGIAMFTGVVLTGENECGKPTADNMIPLGVVDNDERLDIPFHASGSQKGRNIAVKLEGIAEIKFANDIVAGDRVYLGANGVAKKVPTVGGTTAVTYNVLGFAEKTGIAGDVLPVRMSYHMITV